MSIFSSAQNAIKAYKELYKPERKWVRHHLISALRTFKISKQASLEAQNLLTDPNFDGDGNGGMVDAFRHTFWMALNTQKIGKRKALSLGQAHEESNKLYFENNQLEDGALPDSISCEMDLINNQKGAEIGLKYPKASYNEMINIVKDAVLTGKCFKIKKNSKGDFLDYEGNIIDINLIQGKWITPKILIRSDWKEN
ncbi:MAG: hypothetical protein MJ211_09885 [Bacteroidales bacterium]|nr:hypothetical protein [Bacteroidales bacterium]